MKVKAGRLALDRAERIIRDREAQTRRVRPRTARLRPVHRGPRRVGTATDDIASFDDRFDQILRDIAVITADGGRFDSP